MKTTFGCVRWFCAMFAVFLFCNPAQAALNDARFISQSVPATMEAGKSYTVSMTVENTGTSTWTAVDGYKLGSQNPGDNTTWRASRRVELETAVAPGQQYTFTFSVTAPSAGGTYDFQWKMVREFVEWFGASTTNVSVVVPGAVNNARFVAQSVPATMDRGKSYAVSVTMENTGTTTWTSAAGYKLGAQNPADNTLWGPANRVELSQSVAPGSQYTFTFFVTSPDTSSQQNFQWKMVREFVEWFGAATPNIPVQVSASVPGNSARFVSQSVPSAMEAGKSYDVSLTMQNVGTTTWTAAAGYKLGSQNPGDNTTWRAASRVELGTSVAPGKEYTFNFSITAPKTNGTYDFQWKMLREFVEWFGEPALNIQVTVFGQDGESTTFFHNDAAGTPLLATDSTGKVIWKENYRPYGDKLIRAAASSNNSLWFTGKPHDENTGLTYMGARYYDPLLGRFVGIDPTDVDPNNIHSFNRYAYANNNPYKFVDPDGHSPIDVAFLVYDIGKLGIAMYTGVGVVPALVDVGFSVIGVGSPVVGLGQVLKAARATERAVVATKEVGELAKGGAYALKNAEGAVMRTGRTKDLARRRVEHARDPKLENLTFEAQYRTDIRSEQRGLEQMLHDQHNPPLNAINPISPSNPKLQEYLDAAQGFLERHK